MSAMTRTLCLAQNPEADALLAEDRFALLLGMLLDQQIPMEKAFSGPKVLADRMDGLDVHRIAEADPEAFATIMATPPAVHRFPGSMAKRVQALSQFVKNDLGLPFDLSAYTVFGVLLIAIIYLMPMGIAGGIYMAWRKLRGARG